MATRRINHIAFSPDGKLFGVASSEGLNLYTADSLEPARTLEPGNPVTDIAFSADGQKVAVVLDSRRIRVWSLADGTCLPAIEVDGYGGSVRGLALSPDGGLLACGFGPYTDSARRYFPYYGGMELFRVCDGQLVVCLLPYYDPYECGDFVSAAFSPDGSRVTGSWQWAEWTWEVSCAEPGWVGDGRLHRGGYGDLVAHTPDGTRVGAHVSQDYPYGIGVSKADGTHLWLSSHAGHITAVAFSADASLLATSSDDKTVRLSRVADGTLLHVLEVCDGTFCHLAFSADGSILAGASEDGTIYFWGTEDGAVMRQWSLPCETQESPEISV